MPALVNIRDAVLGDVGDINAIYNYEVLNGTATFDTVPMSHEQRHAWLADHDSAHPVLVAETGGRVAGWASLSAWSARPAYNRTAEVSIYVDAEQRGAGVGRALLEALIARARALGLCVLLARIAGPEPASLGLHQALGFEKVGLMRRVGEKHGRLIDVLLMDLHLDEALP